MADDLFNDLVKILQDRDILHDADAIKSAFNDPESRSAIREWMHEYLAPETLLTKEEGNIYATLLKTGEAENLAAQDLSAIRGLNDSEIQGAIEELKRSTAAIEKQSETLRLQHNALSALVKNDQQSTQARSQSDNAQLKKWTAKKDQLNKAVEEQSQALNYQISDLGQQSKASEASMKQTVDSIFKSDDKLLASLQKLASDLAPIQPADDDLIGRIRELCARLIKHTVEGIRTKLDRVYLETICGPSHVANGGEIESEDTQDLQDELESLYSEILPVTQMSTEEQFLKPALQGIAASSGQGQERAAKAVNYIHKCLVFLVGRIEAFLERVEEHQCHRMALQCVLDSAKKELSRVEILSADNKPVSPAKSNAQKRRTSSTTRSPGRPKPSRRRSSGVENDDIDPEQQIARNLGISLPAKSVSDQAHAEVLERALADRVTKLGIHAANLQSITESSISSHLLDSHITLQLLQDCLLAETLYHNVQLVDPDIEASVSMFQQEIQDLQKGLEGIDLEKLQSKNIHREQLIERWSR
ncbi:Uncharacterized protein BP5553_05600 [Venustampulla echinocandica]|uniref:HAUS augmin-like complex subunit 3 N-terminal domain-containing protein n=1 Tax=Venustampulla echinocandica TaxID=2656787 RepID=A0A370TRK7_9HELO|nr:Uncharacterized protein BP5553_05600 [Venustampulla echinocandica]RDL38167.1 Uncharacterized protein BP5553_05600 [Venustampulla echinocandica]